MLLLTLSLLTSHAELRHTQNLISVVIFLYMNEVNEASKESLKAFVNFYSKDVNMELCDEWIQWRAFLQQLPSVPTKPSPVKMLQIMKEYNLQSGFPNVCIALRVYLTLPVIAAVRDLSVIKSA